MSSRRKTRAGTAPPSGDGTRPRFLHVGTLEPRKNLEGLLDAYESLLADLGLDDADVCYVGDDLPDLPVLRRAGLGVAVANARPELLEAADHVTLAAGGEGALRELAETILKAQGKWAAILSRYLD